MKWVYGWAFLGLAVVALLAWQLWPIESSERESQLQSHLPQAVALPPAPEPIAPKPATHLSQHPYVATVLRHFQAGNYQSALRLTQEHLQEPELPPGVYKWLEAQLPALLTSVGWLKAKGGHCDQALQDFERAIQQKPLKEALKGAAYCRFKGKDYDIAQDYIAEYKSLYGYDPELEHIYQDILETDFRYDEARDSLEEGLDAQGEASDQAKKQLRALEKMSKLVEQHNILNAPHFVLSATPRLAEPHDLLDQLEAVLVEFTNRWGFTLPSQAIQVFIYDPDAFKVIVHSSPNWAQGVFDGKIRVQYQSRQDVLVRLLRHELSHALVAELLDDRIPPAWLSEGLAEFLSCPGGCQRFQAPVMPGDFLEQSVFESQSFHNKIQNASLFYRQSWFMVLVLRQLSSSGQPIADIIQGFTAHVAVNSQSLLRPAQLGFDQLYRVSAEKWQSREFQILKR